MKLTNYQLSVAGALWVDVNTQYTVNNLPDRIVDETAIISSSLFNLFNCIPGQRSRIFQPTYGSIWLQFIHEPMSQLTANKMEIFMVQSIKKWEPRITLDMARTYIKPNTNLPGYEVHIAFSMANVSSSQQIQFDLQL